MPASGSVPAETHSEKSLVLWSAVAGCHTPASAVCDSVTFCRDINRGLDGIICYAFYNILYIIMHFKILYFIHIIIYINNK